MNHARSARRAAHQRIGHPELNKQKPCRVINAAIGGRNESRDARPTGRKDRLTLNRVTQGATSRLIDHVDSERLLKSFPRELPGAHRHAMRNFGARWNVRFQVGCEQSLCLPLVAQAGAAGEPRPGL
jgi:hypothetical protein